MAYIGSSASPLPVNFSAVQSQGFNGTGSQTTFTLNRSVGSAASVEVLVNNVQQSPYDGSYNITGGTSLVFSEAPSAGTNNVYVVYRDQALGSLTDTGAVRKTGDTMTGRLTISAGADRSIDLLNSSGVTQGYIGVEGAFGGVPSNALRLRGEGGVVLGANGTAHLTCDSSGRVTMPYQPSFYAHGNGAVVVYSGNTTIAFPVVSHNTGNHYSTATSTFTAPVAGVYHFDVTLYVDRTYLHSVTPMINNAVISGGSNDCEILFFGQNVVSSDYTSTWSRSVYLNAGDTFNIKARPGYANSGIYMGHSKMSGVLIG